MAHDAEPGGVRIGDAGDRRVRHDRGRVRPQLCGRAGAASPTYTELGMVSVMWSEHCSVQERRGCTSATLPTEGPRKLILGPGENAGVVDIGDGQAVGVQDRVAQPPVVHRAVPGGGHRRGRHHPRHLHDGRAADRAARLVAVRDRSDHAIDAARIVEGVVAGIAGYGNSIGIPTVGGEVAFDEAMPGTRWSTCFAWAWRPADRIILASAEGVGQPGLLRRGKDRAAMASMAPRWRPPSSTTRSELEKRPERAGRRPVHGEAAA